MIGADPSRVPDVDLERLARAWFELGRESPAWSPETPLGALLWDLAVEVQNEVDDRRAAIEAIAADVDGIGEIVPPGNGEERPDGAL